MLATLTVQNTTQNDIDRIFDLQKAYAATQKKTSAKTRAAKLKKIVTYLQQHANLLEDAMFKDMRRSPLDTTMELLMVKTEGDFLAKNLKKWMRPQKVATNMMAKSTKPYIIHEPKGVVLIIAPWNAPIACTLVPMMGALAAGNTVIIKPSEISPYSSAAIRDMLQSLFSENEVAIVEGDAQVATHLLSLPFDHIYFTGSPYLGKIVMSAAAKHLTPVTLELGGKSPTIVDETANLEDAAYKIGWGSCANSGQACVSPDYVLVQESVAKEFVQHLSTATTNMYNADGKGFEHSPSLCRIISLRHFNRLKSLLEDAIEKGANIALGGQLNEEDLYISPTILTNVHPDMAIMQEEVFGPILPVMTYVNANDAVQHIASLPKPLAMYIYSSKQAQIDYFIENTSAGSTVVNNNMIQAGVNPYLPFGGVQNSGMGRSVGKASFSSFSNPRSVVYQKTGWQDFSRMSFPPQSAMFKRMINYLFKN